MAEYDNLCKNLAEKYPRDFIRWLLNQEPQQIKILITELSIEPIRADAGHFYKQKIGFYISNFKPQSNLKPH